MLETVREFGLDQLAANNEEEEARNRHAAWYLDLAERVEPELLGPEQRWWCERLETEHANLRAALSWLTESGARRVGTPAGQRAVGVLVPARAPARRVYLAHASAGG